MAKQILMDGKPIKRFDSHETKAWKQFTLDGKTYTFDNAWYVATEPIAANNTTVNRVYSDGGVVQEFNTSEIITCVQANYKDDLVIATSSVDSEEGIYTIRLYLNGTPYSTFASKQRIAVIAADQYGSFWTYKIDTNNVIYLVSIDEGIKTPQGQLDDFGVDAHAKIEQTAPYLGIVDMACTKLGNVIVTTPYATYRYNPPLRSMSTLILRATFIHGMFPSFLAIDKANNLWFIDEKTKGIFLGPNSDSLLTQENDYFLKFQIPSEVSFSDIVSFKYSPDGSLYYSLKNGNVYVNDRKLYTSTVSQTTSNLMVDNEGNWYVSESGVIKNGVVEWPFTLAKTLQLTSKNEFGCKSGNWVSHSIDPGLQRFIEPMFHINIKKDDYKDITATTIIGAHSTMLCVIQIGGLSADSDWNKIPFDENNSYVLSDNDSFSIQANKRINDIGTTVSQFNLNQYKIMDGNGRKLIINVLPTYTSMDLAENQWLILKANDHTIFKQTILNNSGKIDAKSYTTLQVVDVPGKGKALKINDLTTAATAILNGFSSDPSKNELSLEFKETLTLELTSNAIGIEHSGAYIWCTFNTALNPTLNFKKGHTYKFTGDQYGVIDLGDLSLVVSEANAYIIKNTSYTQASCFDGDPGIQEFGFFGHNWSDFKGNEPGVEVWLKTSILPWSAVSGVKIIDNDSQTTKMTITFVKPVSMTWRTHTKWLITKNGVENKGTY